MSQNSNQQAFLPQININNNPLKPSLSQVGSKFIQNMSSQQNVQQVIFNGQQQQQSDFNVTYSSNMSGTKKNRGGLAQALQQQQYNLIFSDGPNQQEITEEALGICKKLAIDPNTIKLKQIQEFEEAGVSETVLKVRFKHYQEKRKNNLETIEKTIRINRGMVLPMGNMNYGFNNRDEISSPGIKLNSSALNTLTRTAKSANRLAVNDHRKASNGFRLNLVDNRNTSYNLFNVNFTKTIFQLLYKTI